MKRTVPLKRSPWPVTADQVARWQQTQQASRLRQAATPRRIRDTGPGRATRDRLAARSGLRCELCGRPLSPGVRQVHHRQPRGIGGSSRPEINALSALLDLCDQCHGLVERERPWAKQRGLLVPHPAIPALIPVDLLDGRWLLTDDGRRIEAPEEVAA